MQRFNLKSLEATHAAMNLEFNSNLRAVLSMSNYMSGHLGTKVIVSYLVDSLLCLLFHHHLSHPVVVPSFFSAI